MKLDNPSVSRYEIVMRQVIRCLPTLVSTIVLFLLLLISGCATSTLNSRKQERAGAYAALSREHKVAVDMGRITFGMNTNAAYISWGPPSVIEVNGTVKIWLYHGSEQRQHKTATARTATGASAAQTGSIEETSVSYPHHVVQAKIIFENDLVKEWSRRERRSLEEDYLEHRR